MPTFDITAPDGTRYEVTGPDGATEQQALQQVMAQHAQPGPQPSFMDRVAASPVGRGIHDFVGGMVGGATRGPLDMARSITDLLPGNGATMAGTPLPQQAPHIPGDPLGIDASYEGALARNRNTPGYAAQRKKADAIMAARPSGVTDQLMAPFLPATAGVSGLVGSLGNLDASNAMADAQADSQGGFAARHPVLSFGANALGSVLTASPEGIAKNLPVYAGDNPTMTRLINPAAGVGPFPLNPRSAPVSPAVDYVRGLVAKSGKSPADLASFDAGGKPFTAAEAIGKPGEYAVGALARRDGETAGQLSTHLSERAESAPDRILTDFSNATGIDPAAARGDIQALVKGGRERAAPLYQQAFDGGSIAPLKEQLANVLTRATSEKGQIAKQIKQIEQNNPGALAARGAAGADVRSQYMQLHEDLKAAEADRQAAMGMFQRAQSDIANNTPGAVWSPRVQQFLDDPIVKQGINRGLEVQRLESLAAGKPFSPNEYAVTGMDEAGKASVGTVPNMRLLDAGKRGLDEILNDYRDTTTGRMNWNERSRAIDQVRRSYLGELDSLNPHYKTARGAAGDYLSAQTAFDNGGKMLLNGNLPAADFSSHFAALDPGDQQAFAGGAANNLFNLAQNGKLTPKVFNRRLVQQKLGVMMGRDKAAQFVTALEHEAKMAAFNRVQAPGSGSGSAPWLEAMRQQDDNGSMLPEALGWAGQVVEKGPIKGSISYGVGRGKDALAAYATRGMPVGVRDEAGRMLMLPPQQLGTDLAKLPTLPVKGPVRVPPQLLPLLGSRLPVSR